MNKFYFTFATGLIDGLLIKTQNQNYITTDMVDRYGKKRKNYRNDVIERERMGQYRTGTIHKTVDVCLYDFLQKEQMKPSVQDDKVDYDQEFTSPFNDQISKLLLVMKWIIGLQSINRTTYIEIKKEDLERLELNVSPFQMFESFKKVFPHVTVYNSYQDKVWTIGFGGRERMIGEGPGYVNIRLDYPYLLEKIKDHHQELRTQKIMQLTDTLTSFTK